MTRSSEFGWPGIRVAFALLLAGVLFAGLTTPSYARTIQCGNRHEEPLAGGLERDGLDAVLRRDFQTAATDFQQAWMLTDGHPSAFRAELSLNLAVMLNQLRRHAEAMDRARESLDWYLDNCSGFPGVGRARVQLALALFRTDRQGEALTMERQAVTDLTAGLGSEAPTTVAARLLMGEIQLAVGQASDGRAVIRSVLDYYRTARRNGPIDPEIDVEQLGVDCYHIALGLAKARAASSDVNFYVTAAVETLEQTAPDDNYFATGLAKAADGFRNQGDYVIAEPLLRRAIAIFSTNKKLPAVAVATSNLGETLEFLGKHDEAHTLLIQALAYFEELGEDYVEDQEHALNWLGIVELDQQHFAESLPYFQREYDLVERVSPHSERIVTAISNVLRLRLQLGQTTEAETLLGELAKYFQDHPNDDPSEFARSSVDLAGLYSAQRQTDRALLHMQRAELAYQTHFGENDPGTGELELMLAEIQLGLGNIDIAKQYADRAAPVFGANPSEPDGKLADLDLLEGRLSLADRRFEQAASHFRNALERLRVGVADHQYGDSLATRGLAAALFLGGARFDEVEPLLRQKSMTREIPIYGNVYDLMRTRYLFSTVLIAAHRRSEAMPVIRQLHRLCGVWERDRAAYGEKYATAYDEKKVCHDIFTRSGSLRPLRPKAVAMW